MKRIATIGVAIIVFLFSTNVVRSATVDAKLVEITATISSFGTMNMDFLKIADDTDVGAIEFGAVENTVGDWSTLPKAYIKISVIDDAPSWTLRVYTDNFKDQPAPEISTWGYQYGGLVDHTRPGAKVALGWLASESLRGSTGPVTGNPADGRKLDNTVDPPQWLSGGNGFTYLKDKSDNDDPIQPGNQGFVITDGYLTVAFGSPSYTRVVRPDLEPGNIELATATSPFYFYVEGQFRGASAADYGTMINFDLVSE